MSFTGNKQRILSASILFMIIFLADTIIGKAYILGAVNTRTSSIEIGDGLNLNFSIHWGPDMDQTISISRYFYVFASKKEKVFRKPYWAGGPLYANNDKSHYYMVVRSGTCTQECYIFFHVNVTDKKITVECDIDQDAAKNLDYVGQFSITPSWGLSGRGGGVSFTSAGQQPEGFNFEADPQRNLKRWCDD